MFTDLVSVTSFNIVLRAYLFCHPSAAALGENEFELGLIALTRVEGYISKHLWSVEAENEAILVAVWNADSDGNTKSDFNEDTT